MVPADPVRDTRRRVPILIAQSRVEPPRVASEPAFRHGRCELHHADGLDWLRARDEHSVHAVVTDPPYGLIEYTDEEQDKLRKGRGGVWRIPPSFDGHQRAPLPRFTTLRPEDHVRLEAFFRTWAEHLLPGRRYAGCPTRPE